MERMRGRGEERWRGMEVELREAARAGRVDVIMRTRMESKAMQRSLGICVCGASERGIFTGNLTW